MFFNIEQSVVYVCLVFGLVSASVNVLCRLMFASDFFLQDHTNSQCATIKTLILQLIDFRSQIMSGTLPAVRYIVLL